MDWMFVCVYIHVNICVCVCIERLLCKNYVLYISTTYVYLVYIHIYEKQILMVWNDENELVIVAQIPSLIYIDIFILSVTFMLFLIRCITTSPG